jgi:hypothetical protein
MLAYSERGVKPSGFHKSREFLEQLRNYQLFKKIPAPLNASTTNYDFFQIKICYG